MKNKLLKITIRFIVKDIKKIRNQTQILVKNDLSVKSTIVILINGY